MADNKHGSEEKKEFRLSCKHIFLTYAQANSIIRREIIRDHLIAQFGRHRIERFIIAEERHEDGNKHYHVLCTVNPKCNVRTIDFFDVRGCHPNIQAAGNSRSVEAYCRKYDDTPLEEGFETHDWILVAEQGNTVESLNRFKRLHPLQYTVHYETVRRNIQAMGKRPKTAPYELQSFRTPVGFYGWDEAKCLIISGHPGIGKSKLAMALANGPFCFVRHADALKSFNEGDVIIFDDFDFRGKSREEVIHMIDVEDESQINVKHSMVCIPPGTRRIITTNYVDGNELFPADPYNSIDRRVQWLLCGNVQLF